MDYERATFRYTETNRKIGEATRDLFAGWYPKALGPAVRHGIYALLDDSMLEAFGFPRPHPLLRRLVAGSLALRGRVVRFFPPRRTPSFFTDCRNRTHPAGYAIAHSGPRDCGGPSTAGAAAPLRAPRDHTPGPAPGAGSGNGRFAPIRRAWTTPPATGRQLSRRLCRRVCCAKMGCSAPSSRSPTPLKDPLIGPIHPMKVEYTDVSVTEKSLVVEIPTEVVEEQIQRVTHGYARTLKLPGFRPGKVPAKVVRQRFMPQILQDVAEDLIPRAVDDVLRERGVEPVDTPSVKDVSIDEHQPLKFTAAIATAPPVDPGPARRDPAAQAAGQRAGRGSDVDDRAPALGPGALRAGRGARRRSTARRSSPT